MSTHDREARHQNQLLGLAALGGLLVLSWALHFAYKPGCWRALVWLVDALLPPSCEWSHDGYIALLRWQDWLENVVLRELMLPEARP
jgi:hypothetical protein